MLASYEMIAILGIDKHVYIFKDRIFFSGQTGNNILKMIIYEDSGDFETFPTKNLNFWPGVLCT